PSTQRCSESLYRLESSRREGRGISRGEAGPGPKLLPDPRRARPGRGAFKPELAALIAIRWPRTRPAACAPHPCPPRAASAESRPLRGLPPGRAVSSAAKPTAPPTPRPHVGRPRLWRRQERLRRPRGARVRPRPGERRHLLVRLQARLLQLPAAVARPGVRGPCWADQEAASPVLTPEGAPPPWYQALQPEELRWLQAPEEDTAPEAPPEAPGPEPGPGQSQPLRHDDLKEMLDTNKDSLKLEAMKRIVAMIARGKNASDLFPAVVKNVACKNIEVKKLVYVYLVRYAEEQQDLALLSISTFQRGLKDPNQLIRASALRVLSSIRVPIIVPIMMLAIKEAASDMSPYVRKTAAHAIPKLYSLDSDQKDQLIEVIEKLLADKTTVRGARAGRGGGATDPAGLTSPLPQLVAGSVVMAFEEVCPERIELIHKNYRKLCNLLIDVEEWGQVVIISMLTRYARTQFLCPTRSVSGAGGGAGARLARGGGAGGGAGCGEAPTPPRPQESLLEENPEKAFYGSEEDEAKGAGSEEAASAALPAQKPYVMDPDHRLLLRNTKPLLQSRSAAVVMAVAQLYFHLAPKAEVGVIAKALVRLLRSHSEVQYVVLQNVATMSIKRRGMFEPYLKSFYIRSTDPTQIKILKVSAVGSPGAVPRAPSPRGKAEQALEVLTNLANETNIPTVLREFQTYIRSVDKDFVAATIQAIGRCATNIGRVRDTCLNGLVQLLSNRDELVVAESVVVIKKLLQMQPAQHGEIIKHLAKLMDNIQVPMARASVLWLVGEYCERVPATAPDVLRRVAKSFAAEEDIVKLQAVNLAAKLYLTNSKQAAAHVGVREERGGRVWESWVGMPALIGGLGCQLEKSGSWFSTLSPLPTRLLPQTKLLTQYVLSLAKYDQNYDIRDRARFTRQLIVPSEQGGTLSRHAKKLFLAPKPAPVLESSFKDRDHFQLGSLSHLLNAKATGYQELPDWPEEAPDPSVRNVEVSGAAWWAAGRPRHLPMCRKISPLLTPTWACWADTAGWDRGGWEKAQRFPSLPSHDLVTPPNPDLQVPEWTKCSSREKRKEKEKPFYSDSEGESGPTESADSDPESESESDSKSSSESGSGEASSDSDNEDQDEDEEKGRSSESEQSDDEGEKAAAKRKKAAEGRGGGSPSDEDSDSSSSSSGSETTSQSEEGQAAPASWGKKAPAAKEISLLDLEDFTPPSVQPVSPPAVVSTSLAADLEGLTLTDSPLVPSPLSPASGAGRQELLHRVAGEGLAVDYTFSRQPFSGDPRMVSVHLHLSNSSDNPIKGLHVGTPKLPAGISIQEFPEIESLAPGESATAVMGINFCDSTQAANFQLTQTRQFYVSIQPPVGELMAPVFLSENEFKKEQGKLTGMNEISEKLTLPEACRSDHAVVLRVTATAHLGRVPCGASEEYRFAGRTLTSGSLVLLTLDARPTGAAQLTVNSEKMVIGTMLVKDVVQALTQ
ncbi:AP-3 complex subunit beta-2, partial [Galemys pyrenaicus]